MLGFFSLQFFEVSVSKQNEQDLTYKQMKIWGIGYSIPLLASVGFTFLNLRQREHSGLVGATLHTYIKSSAISSRQRRSCTYFTAQSASTQEHAHRARNTAQDSQTVNRVY